MEKVFTYLFVFGILLLFFISIQKFSGIILIKVFKLLYNIENADKWTYSFTDEVILKMNINYKLYIGFNKKSKKTNANVMIYKDNVFIVLHGKLNNDELKFIISHELAHIKFKHTLDKGSTFFIFALSIIGWVVYEILIHIYPKIIEVINKNVAILTLIGIVNIALLVESNISAKKNRQYENQADLEAAKIVGKSIAINAINMIEDKYNFKVSSTHPSKKERIDYILNNINA